MEINMLRYEKKTDKTKLFLVAQPTATWFLMHWC